MKTYGFYQKIHEPTYRINECRSTIDNIFVNNNTPVQGRVVPTTLSSHDAKYFRLSAVQKRCTAQKPVKRRIYFQSKMSAFRAKMETVDWTELYQVFDPNLAYNRFL
ncbi:hypothetical protein HHI36_022720 [Cryptolaemus montrouzieri]|uniref:Uncharacterized protein n=1 Tax=Cryptolaemus montrouzieri TaxID=559131 RepID=A0ABD2N102_9CUCU